MLWQAVPIFTFPQPENVRVTSVSRFIGAVATVILMVGFMVFFALFLWGGVQWLTSQGDQAAIQAARQRLTVAFIGVAIIALGAAIILLLQWFFGLTIIGDFTLPQAFE